MQLSGEKKQQAFHVTVEANRIDAGSAIQFKDKFREVIEDVEGKIVLDLSQVDFLDSSGLGAVVAALKLLGSDRSLSLAGLTPTVAKVFRLTRMDSVFTIHDDAETALAAAAQG